MTDKQQHSILSNTSASRPCNFFYVYLQRQTHRVYPTLFALYNFLRTFAPGFAWICRFFTPKTLWKTPRCCGFPLASRQTSKESGDTLLPICPHLGTGCCKNILPSDKLGNLNQAGLLISKLQVWKLSGNTRTNYIMYLILIFVKNLFVQEKPGFHPQIVLKIWAVFFLD